MALIHCSFFSEALAKSTSIYVILPQETRGQIGMGGSRKREKYPILYLLHGLSDDHTIWQRRTSIERYVADMGIAVVMPNVDKSFYTDMVHGDNYFTFISEELPQICQDFFPLSEKREDNFVAGLSMGGYGAFKVALSHPDKYCAAASLSGVVDIANRVEQDMDETFLKLTTAIYGEDLKTVRNSKNDLFYLANNVANSIEDKPKLYQCCGTEDFLYKDNLSFKNFVKEKDLDYTYEEWQGNHDWAFWDTAIQKVLNWLPIENK